MPYTIEQIEAAVIQALEPLRQSLGIREVKTYQGEIDSEDDLKSLARRFPAIYVIYGGSRYPEQGVVTREVIDIHVIVCDRNLRSADAARRGGAANPGTYAMLAAVRDRLHGQKAGLGGLVSFRLLEEAPVWYGRGVSIIAARYETGQKR